MGALNGGVPEQVGTVQWELGISMDIVALCRRVFQHLTVLANSITRSWPSGISQTRQGRRHVGGGGKRLDRSREIARA